MTLRDVAIFILNIRVIDIFICLMGLWMIAMVANWWNSNE